MCYTEFTISAWRRIFTGIGGDMLMSNESVFLPAAVRDRIWDLHSRDPHGGDGSGKRAGRKLNIAKHGMVPSENHPVLLFLCSILKFSSFYKI